MATQTRRCFLSLAGSASVAAVAGLAAPTSALAAFDQTMPRTDDLLPTACIDSDHARIRDLAARLSVDPADPRTSAVAIHDYVRDQVPFGFAPAFYDQKASEALRAGLGFCNTKSTLFVALLRAAGIPARQYFVDIDRRILNGLIDPGTPYVDHSYTELWLNGRWTSVDSYIVDRPLFYKAKQRLEQDGSEIGYGIHIDGTVDWHGTNDAFSQFVRHGRIPSLSTRDHGVHADVQAFYAASESWNELGFVGRLFFPIAAGSANRAIDRVRAG